MPGFDADRIFSVLAAHEVRYILIGGLAARFLGASLLTDDFDICYERSPENLAKLAAALQELQATLRGVDEVVPFLLDDRTLAAGDHFTFTTIAGSFDILGIPAGSAGYAQLLADARRVRIGDSEITVASVDDLIAMKRAAGRRKDIEAIALLEGLRDELEAE